MSQTTTETRKWIDVAGADGIADGEVKTFQVEAYRVAVARANGQLYAVQDLCSHDDGPLGAPDAAPRRGREHRRRTLGRRRCRLYPPPPGSDPG